MCRPIYSTHISASAPLIRMHQPDLAFPTSYKPARTAVPRAPLRSRLTPCLHGPTSAPDIHEPTLRCAWPACAPTGMHDLACPASRTNPVTNHTADSLGPACGPNSDPPLFSTTPRTSTVCTTLRKPVQRPTHSDQRERPRTSGPTPPPRAQFVFTL